MFCLFIFFAIIFAVILVVLLSYLAH